MKIIANIYYQNEIVDAQAINVKLKKKRPCPIEIDIDAAVNHTLAPKLIATAVARAVKTALTSAALNLQDNPRPPTESG